MQIQNFVYLIFVIGIFLFDNYWLSSFIRVPHLATERDSFTFFFHNYFLVLKNVLKIFISLKYVNRNLFNEQHSTQQDIYC